MPPITTLLDRDQEHGEPTLSSALQELYGGDVHFPPSLGQRPYVFGNFVSTLDGVISYRIAGHSGGAAISGSDESDRFIMGLLRASADAVLVGAHTVHEVSPKHLWIPSYVYPEAKDLYQQYREALRKPNHPLVVIISGSGRLDLSRAIFRTPEVQAVILTSTAGQNELSKAGASRLASVAVKSIESMDGKLDPRAVLQLLFSQFGVHAVLHEGGPALFGQFVELKLVDELFLTLAHS